MQYDKLKIKHIKKIEDGKIIFRTIFTYEVNGFCMQKNIECEKPLYEDFLKKII